MPTIEDKRHIEEIATAVSDFCDEQFTHFSPSMVGNGLMFVVTRMARMHIQQHRPDLTDEQLSGRAEEIFEQMSDLVAALLHRFGSPVESSKNGSSKHRN